MDFGLDIQRCLCYTNNIDEDFVIYSKIFHFGLDKWIEMCYDIDRNKESRYHIMKKQILSTALVGVTALGLAASVSAAETSDANVQTLPNAAAVEKPAEKPAVVSSGTQTSDEVDFNTLFAQDQSTQGKKLKLMDETGAVIKLDGKEIEVTVKSGQKVTVDVQTKRGVYRLTVQEKDGKAFLVDSPQLIQNAVAQVQNGWVKTKAGKWQYLKGGEHLPAGWANLEGKWYFFDPEGNLKQEGWEFINGKWYYLSPVSGAMETGWLQIGNQWYYLKDSGAMASGWEFVDGKWYFLDQSGVMKSNTWFKVDGKWYYAYSSGALAINTTVGGYVVDKSGAWVE